MSVIGSGGVEQTVADIEHDTEPPAKPGRRSGARRRDGLAGWLFMAPAFIVVVIFVLLPVFSALWVSASDWNGKGSPLTANFVRVDKLSDPVDQTRSGATGSGHRTAQQHVLRLPGGAAANGAGAGAGDRAEPPATEGQGLF